MGLPDAIYPSRTQAGCEDKFIIHITRKEKLYVHDRVRCEPHGDGKSEEPE